MLEKFNPKGEWTKIKYEQFCNEVIGFGTALTRKLGLKDTRVVIIGENTYHWYVSYMTMLCGAGIAVPVDKELPENEIENVIKRSKASAVIFSTKKSEVIKRVSEKLPDVKYFIQMNSDSELANRFVGMQYLIDEGKLLVKTEIIASWIYKLIQMNLRCYYLLLEQHQMLKELCYVIET